MPQVVFLLGGTGNQLFQISTSAEHAVFSPFFLRGIVRRILGWTDHEQIISPPQSNFFLTGFALLILAIDVLAYQVLGRTFRTDLNTRRITCLSRSTAWVRLGYFHHLPQIRSIEDIVSVSDGAASYDVAIHYRGGDIIETRAQGVNDYGILSAGYYAQIETLKAGSVVVLTDDTAAAQAHFKYLDFCARATFLKVDLKETLQIALNAGAFVSCPSTLSYWICQLRGGKGCIVQTPFLRTNPEMSPAHSLKRIAKFE